MPALIFEGHDIARSVYTAAHVGEMGRAVIVPAEFVPPHELDPHGPADRLRHHCSSNRAIVMAGTTEHAGAFIVLDLHLIGGEPKRLSQHVAHAVRKLGRAHHERAPGADIGERAAWRKWSVGLIRPIISC